MLPGLGDEGREPIKVIPLRRLLGGLTSILFVGASTFLLWDLALGTTRNAALLFLLVLVFGGAAAVLFTLRSPTVDHLRVIERTVFTSLTGYLAWTTYDSFARMMDAGDTSALAARWNLVPIQFGLVMLAYGTLVPNAWRRAARVIAGIALTPVAVVSLLDVSGPHRSAALAELATPERVFEGALVLTVAAGISVLAAYIIDQYLMLAARTGIAIRYVLKRRIALGGMGEVWLAEHDLLARPAAVKLIRADMIDADHPQRADVVMRRFEREAKATARLRSAHTVEVYDFGITEDRTFYYAMEHLEGIDLSTLVKQHGPLPAARAVYLLRQACQSLADAHDQGFTHRDIKPGNIFICRMGTAHDFVKVLDFGLVTAGRDEMTATEGITDLTVDGQIAGTPAYMAPELIQGGESEPDGRADLYALGCVGYWLLTGAPVFEGPPMSVLIDHVKTAPKPPSQRTELQIPADLEALILRCLAKDPADRYQSAEELAEALAACCPEPPWSPRQASEWWRLHLPTAA